MKKAAALLFLLNAIWISNGYGQETDSVQPVSAEPVAYDFLLLSTQYQTRTTFMGRDFGQRTPLFSTDIMFWHSSGIYLSASLSKFFVEDLTWQEGFGLGFAGQFSKKADFDFSISEFFGASYINATGTDNMGVIQGSVGLDWGLLYSTTQLQFLVNEPNDFFLVSNHSRYFELDKRLWNTAVFSFEPRLSFFFGTSNYYRLGGYDMSWREFLETDEFKIQSMEMAIPMNLMVGSFEFQLEPKWVLPLNVPDYDTSTSNLQGTLKVTYALPLNKSK